MRCKTIEVRDAATFIPVLAVKLEPECEEDRYLLARAGYGTNPERQGEYVLLLRLDGPHYDPYSHGTARTLAVAHEWLIANFDLARPGEVVDVQFLLGETAEPKRSERLTAPGPY